MLPWISITATHIVSRTTPLKTSPATVINELCNVNIFLNVPCTVTYSCGNYTGREHKCLLGRNNQEKDKGAYQIYKCSWENYIKLSFQKFLICYQVKLEGLPLQMSPAVFPIGGHAALHHSPRQALCIQLIFSANCN